MFQQAFWLAKKELKYHLLPIVFTVLVTVFIGVFTGFLLEESVRALFNAEATSYNRFLLDMMFIGLTPAFASIFMSGPYLSFQTIKDDTYSKRMALFRSLPIPVSVLSLSRTIVMLITLLIMSSAFYITISIVLSEHFFELFIVKEFIIFLIIWFGYALALGGLNPFIEYGTNGKVLHTVPFVFIAIFIITVLIFYNLVEQGIVETMLFLVKDVGWPLALISFIVGCIGCFVWNKLLTIRLERRDYL